MNYEDRSARRRESPSQWAYVAECENEGPIIITRNGKAAAILLAPKDSDDLERLMLAHSRRFQSLFAKSRRSIKAGKGVSHEEFWKLSLGVIKPNALRKSEKNLNWVRKSLKWFPYFFLRRGSRITVALEMDEGQILT